MTDDKTEVSRRVFLAERKRGIGGSDVASLFNVGYGCRLRLWRDKRDETPDYLRNETDAMELGKVLEPFFLAKYARITGRDVVQRGAVAHPEYPFLRVNVDAMVNDANDDQRDVGVLENKAVGNDVFWKIKREGLPEDYILQLQHGMLVTQSDWGSFAIGSRNSGELLHWDVLKNEVLWDRIIAEGTTFWEEVQTGRMPERLEPDDHRCQKCEYRKSCQGAALIQIDNAQAMEQDETLRPVFTEYLERRALQEEATALTDEKKEELKTLLGTRTAVAVAGHRIYYRTQTSMRGDFASLATSYDELRKLLFSILHEHPGLGPQQHRFGDEFTPSDTFKKRSDSRPLRIF